jgi:hypothetical protein
MKAVRVFLRGVNQPHLADAQDLQEPKWTVQIEDAVLFKSTASPPVDLNPKNAEFHS